MKPLTASRLAAAMGIGDEAAELWVIDDDGYRMWCAGEFTRAVESEIQSMAASHPRLFTGAAQSLKKNYLRAIHRGTWRPYRQR